MADDATETMIANLSERTGRRLDEWLAVLEAARPAKHGEALRLLKSEHGMTHGYANLVASRYFEGQTGPVAIHDLVDAQYSGAKASLRPLYEQLLIEVQAFGGDVEVAPKKTYVSLRRSKQFALIQPASRDRIDVGLNLPGESPSGRLVAATGMCSHKVRVSSLDDLDPELIGTLRRAYERA